MTRRTQAERSDAASAALVGAATLLFGRDGYAATSIESVAAEAGMTKGAAYHHFDGKAGLFRAVFVKQEEDLAASVAEGAGSAPDAWAAVLTGCRIFLRRCLEQQVRQIVLLDGPAVLGWAEVRRIEQAHTLHVLHRGLDAAVHQGRIAAGDITARSHLIFGALCEAGMLLARADDPDAAIVTVTAETEHLLNALATR